MQNKFHGADSVHEYDMFSMSNNQFTLCRVGVYIPKLH